jgi:hypothetical protein
VIGLDVLALSAGKGGGVANRERGRDPDEALITSSKHRRDSPSDLIQTASADRLATREPTGET